MLNNLYASLSEFLIEQLCILVSATACSVDTCTCQVVGLDKVYELVDLIRLETLEVDFITVRKLY